MSATLADFSALFNIPSVETMHKLLPKDFERFVAYVLRRAGYDVKEVGPHWLKGVDLEMRRPGAPAILGGVECKRFQTSAVVQAEVVSKLKGAASVSKPAAKPYVITTSDFHENAHKIAGVGKPAYLMNGSQLVRYINYVRGSRYDDDTSALISPENFCGQGTFPNASHNGARVLTIANNKGGVGKTTTAYYLGVELANQGKRVLLIDLDGQANLTERCFPETDISDYKTVRSPNIAEYFAGQRPLQETVKEVTITSKGKLSIIASDPLLALRDLGGIGRPDIETRFAQDVQKLTTTSLASLGGAPDWIIIDTPPALSVFTRAGLATANYVLAPVRPRTASVAGTTNMLNTLQTMRALVGSTGAIFLGVVITHWDNLKLSENFASDVLPDRLRGSGGHAFEITIPIDNQLEILQPGAKTSGAEAYRDLADEVLRDVQSREAKLHGRT